MPVALPLALGASAIAGVVGSTISANAATKAADTQAQSQRAALGLQQQEFQQGQTNLAPYLTLGQGATNQLEQLYGLPGPNGTTVGGLPGASAPNFSAFTNFPGFQFASQYGNKAVQNYLASTGQATGAAGLQAVSEFNNGLAQQQFWNYTNSLTNLAQMGGNAAGASAQLASNAAGTMGQTTGNIGTALGAGQATAGNIMGSGVSNMGNNALMAAMLYSLNPSAFKTA